MPITSYFCCIRCTKKSSVHPEPQSHVRDNEQKAVSPSLVNWGEAATTIMDSPTAYATINKTTMNTQTIQDVAVQIISPQPTPQPSPLPVMSEKAIFADIVQLNRISSKESEKKSSSDSISDETAENGDSWIEQVRGLTKLNSREQQILQQIAKVSIK